MKAESISIRLCAIGSLALAVFTSGCAGNPSASLPLAPILPDSKPDGVACAATTNSQDFNGTAIARHSWIWFSSVMSVPHYKGTLTLKMLDSEIDFTNNGRRYHITGPDMQVVLHDSQSVHLRFGGIFWTLKAPPGTRRNDFLNGLVYHAKDGLPGGIHNVTWSAKFYSVTPHEFRWQWGAAVYTQFVSWQYRRLGVKALADDRYPPYNSDPAGTPERYKQYLTAGATGAGGSDYTGGLGPTAIVTPCIWH
jgi:hypothetical protein